MKLPVCRLSIFLLFVALSSCTSAPEPTSERPDELASETSEPVRNVILIIGDGMGPQQLGLLQEYARRAPNSIYNGRPTAIEELAVEGVISLASTTPHDGLVVDSACSATHLATGQDALLEAVGVDAQGDAATTILEIAREMGKSTGLVSDTRITHATPASFAAHISHRSRENEIAQQMLDADVDVMLSGGLRNFIPRAVNDNPDLRAQYEAFIDDAFDVHSAREDDTDLLSAAEEAGYQLAFHREGLRQAEGDRVLGLFSNSGMLDAIAERATRDESDRTEPTLTEMSLAALERLDRNPNGFFLMIEAGQIDWAGHDNDAGLLLHEMIRIDETVAEVRRWAEGRTDTLLIVTADHETGGFGFSYSAADLPEPQHRPGSAFGEIPYQPNYNFGSLEILDALFLQSKSFAQMLSEFYSGEDQSPYELQKVVNAHSQFQITTEDAEAVLRDSPNRFHAPGHPYLDAESLPHVEDFSAFYPYGDDSRKNLLGRALSTQQNVVWSTGTHTHTPVPVIAWGPAHWTGDFDRFLHLKDVGRLAIEAMSGSVQEAGR